MEAFLPLWCFQTPFLELEEVVSTFRHDLSLSSGDLPLLPQVGEEGSQLLPVLPIPFPFCLQVMAFSRQHDPL